MFNIRDQEQAVRDIQTRFANERQQFERATQSNIATVQRSLLRTALKTSVSKGAKFILRPSKPRVAVKQTKRRNQKKFLAFVGLTLSAWLIYSSRRD